MYKTLWNSINKQVKDSHASAAFLAVSLMGWTTIGLLAGFLICIIGGMSFVTKVTVVLCSGGYTGLILGFFGGILYLYRSESRHLTDSTTHSFPLLLVKYLSTPRQLPGNKPDSFFYPRATSRIIIRENPTAKKRVPMLECSPADISGMSSSTTT